ncbi:MAG: hypothetical protein F9K27_07790 [Anaerolineae bacterium]|nr:MAG: hypothetical protein F9K27_07790 [Anaerolineae bacterium]
MSTMTNGCLGLIISILGALGLLGLLGVLGIEQPPLPEPFAVTVEPFATWTPLPTPFASPTPTATPVGEAHPAEVGDQEGEIPVGGGEVWMYDGEAGEIISISIRADNPANDTTVEERIEQGLLDVYAYVYDPDGFLLAEADDIESGILTDVQIDELELPVTGTYRIEVRSWDNTNGGGYTLSIKSSRSLAPTP